MRMLPLLRLALRLLGRELRAGEVRLLAAAIVIAVAGVTTVGFFIDRVQQALNRGANELLGGDLVLVSDRPVSAAFVTQARSGGLAAVEAIRFPTMVTIGERNVLSELKAVEPGYPLRGTVRIADALGQSDRPATAVPQPGTLWVDERLATRIGVAVGDVVTVGYARFRVAAILTQEPDVNVSFLNLGPRAILHRADLDATRLIQPGSRITYRLLVAGEPDAVSRFRNWAGGRLVAGQRLEGIRDARPEVRSALSRAERFIGLASLTTVALAAVAIALATRRYVQRHLDGCAVMRCMGANQTTILFLHLAQFTILALFASIVGALLGYLAQEALSGWLSSLVRTPLPPAGWTPWVEGLALGLLQLLGFAAPPLLALANVPTLRVLRREIGVPGGAGIAGYAFGLGTIAGLIAWKAGDLRLAAYATAGFFATVLVSALVVWLLLRLGAGMSRGTGGAWRFGLASLRRHRLGTIVQVVALGLGIMALLTLTMVRGDLLQSWRTSLPADAPNRFIVNIQPDQVQGIRDFFAERRLAAPALYPMVRGRLTGINGAAVSSGSYADERARRLIDREFNLSWADTLRADNLVVAGRWYGAQAQGRPVMSMEEGIAQTLGIRLGDRLTWDIAGATISVEVTSLRKVDWDSFRANFFVLVPSGVIDGYPASYMTSFHLPERQLDTLAALAGAFPNVLVIDIATIIGQVTRIMEQVSAAVQFVFLFTLVAGIVVLYAAVAATRDERVFEAAVLRTLGASRRQVTLAHCVEFSAIGALAGLFAAAGATGLGYFVATRVLNVPFAPGGLIWVLGVAGGMAGVAVAGLAATRGVLRVPPLASLRGA
jgi:putative ABC transport system permease protein